MGQISEYLKHLIIRTPFEEPLLQLRNAMGTLGKDPKLKEVYLEPKRLEKFMRKVLKKSSNCIDVGAHLGSFLSLIYRISPEGRHMAFEPVPQKASLGLASSIRLSPVFKSSAFN